MEIKFKTKKLYVRRGSMGMEYTKYLTRCPRKRTTSYGAPVMVGDLSCRKCVHKKAISDAEAVCMCE